MEILLTFCLGWFWISSGKAPSLCLPSSWDYRLETPPLASTLSSVDSLMSSLHIPGRLACPWRQLFPVVLSRVECYSPTSMLLRLGGGARVLQSIASLLYVFYVTLYPTLSLLSTILYFWQQLWHLPFPQAWLLPWPSQLLFICPCTLLPPGGPCQQPNLLCDRTSSPSLSWSCTHYAWSSLYLSWTDKPPLTHGC
jgi:hypothetical protein